jgi:hypothetical protein
MHKRSRKGFTIAELAGLLLVFFILLVFPFINLAAIGIRCFTVIAAAKEAAHKAAKSLTYEKPAPAEITLGNNQPALTVANNVVAAYAKSFNGITIQNVRVGIVVVNTESGAESPPVYAPLTKVDQLDNSYYLDVDITASTEPLLAYRGGLLGNVPGLTSPLSICAHAHRYFENAKGLVM